MSVEVRRIRADEWRQYRALRLEALQDTPSAFVEQYGDVVQRGDEFWQDRVSRSATGAASCTYVAVPVGADSVGADNVGFVGKASGIIRPEQAQLALAHLVGVYVTPRFRGRGVAQAVVAAVLRWAREEPGASRVQLFVTQTNARAAAFYRRLGFAPTGVTQPYPPDPALLEDEMEYRVDR